MTEPRYCSLLWSHISNEPLGHVRTCCIAKERVTDDDGNDFTLGSTSVRDIFHSNYYKNIRQEIRDGKFPDNCEPCWREEKNGKKSKRQIYNEYAEWRFDPIDYSVEPDMPHDMQLILSTTCNLKCRSCNPNYSSKWVKEADSRGLPYHKEIVSVPMSDLENSKFWTLLDDWLPHIVNLEIMGGEPLYMKEFKVFANKLIDDGIAPRVSLSFSTNGTMGKSNFLGRIIDQFKSVSFNISVDAAVGNRFDYLRHGADWDEVVENLDYIHNLQQMGVVFSGITCTVTALNIMYLAEFHEVFQERWPNFHVFHNIANLPSWYNPNVFPNEMKEAIVKPLVDGLANGLFKTEHVQQEMRGLIAHATTPREECIAPYGNGPDDTIENEINLRWKLFKQQVTAGDHYREEDFRSAFPELWEIVKHDFFYSKHIEAAKLDPKYGTIDRI